MDGIKSGKKELILPISQAEHWDLGLLSELPKVTQAVSKAGAEPVFPPPDQESCEMKLITIMCF